MPELYVDNLDTPHTVRFSIRDYNLSFPVNDLLCFIETFLASRYIHNYSLTFRCWK